MTIAILCPTRGRPEQFNRMVDSVKKTSTAAAIYSAASPEEHGITITMLVPDMMPTAQKWNLLAERAMKDKSVKLFMLGADDMIFDTPGWDRALLDHYNALENKIHVYALQDSRDAEGTPHIFVTREYIEAMGYFVPPIFLHWNIDVWTVEIAKHNNVFTHMKDYLLIHDKPSDKGQCDETFSRIRSWGWRERDAYVAEKCAHFLDVEKERLALIIRQQTRDRSWAS